MIFCCAFVGFFTFRVRQESDRNVILLTSRIALLEAAARDARQANADASQQLTRTSSQLETINLQVRASNVEWTSSSDGKVQVRLVSNHHYCKPGTPTTLFFQLRNTTHESITVHGPGVAPWDLSLELDGTKARFRGPIPEPAEPVPVDLLPGEIIGQELQISRTDFRELDQFGMFVASAIYHSGNASNPNIWVGQIGPIKTTWQQR
jgi:hypothetical protein